MLKLNCPLPNISPHNSTSYKNYRLFEGDKDLCKKIGVDMTIGPIIFLREKQTSTKPLLATSSNMYMILVKSYAVQ